jgi:NADH:ubiquinone oxidoreductase subunit 3 (subunit A)
MIKSFFKFLTPYLLVVLFLIIFDLFFYYLRHNSFNVEELKNATKPAIATLAMFSFIYFLRSKKKNK